MILFNIFLGLLPTFVLAGSIAAGIDDDAQHRRMFFLVYGLWSLTLAMWNWMRSTSVWWIVLWSAAGVVALVCWRAAGRRSRIL